MPAMETGKSQNIKNVFSNIYKLYMYQIIDIVFRDCNSEMCLKYLLIF